MGKSLIKLIAKPRKPVRQTVSKQMGAYPGVTLDELVEYFKGCDFSKVTMDSVYGYGEDDDYDFVCSRLQTDEELEADMIIFLAAKKKYDAWYRKNRELIEKEKQRRKDVAKAKTGERDLSERNRLKDRILKLNKRLRDAEKRRHS